MTSISSLNLSNAPAARRRLQPAKPESYAVCAWLNSSSKTELLSCRIRRKQISKLTKCGAILDASQVMSEKVSSAQTPEEANRKIEECTAYIKELLTTFGDGRISVSPYDTSMVALIKDVQGRNAPQFPSCLEWIGQNQKADGSWGDDYYSIHDRIVNTLACVVALKSWNFRTDNMEKGVTYIKENVHKLKDASMEHATCGFEIVVPATLERAKDLGIQGLPYDHPIIMEITNIGERRLAKIPMNLIYKTPTSLLHSLEGLKNVDWEKILKLQSPDGSFLSSPASTAAAFMQTKDEKCLKFIDNTVKSCGGQVPNVYRVDLFARLWAVDRLQRLGVSHFFKEEIKSLLDHIKRFWTETGVFCARYSNFSDIDDTSMGIRLFKMHGYNVDPNALEHFKHKDGTFCCFSDQMIESASPIYNLYRAAQLRFPGEDILEEASKFAYTFLQEKLANDQIQEKWIKIGMKMPWYATLPRVEAAYYLEHYEGSGDVWIGKAYYRMPEISNDTYKELAVLDFNRCQAQHQLEWSYMQEWYHSSKMKEFGITKKELLVAYFLGAATIFERERSQERIMWVKSQIVSRMITSFLNKQTTTPYSYSDQKTWLLTQLGNNFNSLHKMNGDKKDYGGVDALLTNLQQLLDGSNEYTRHRLRNAWRQWFMKLHQGEGNGGADAELQANTLNIRGAHIAVNDDVLSHNEYTTLSILTSKICQQLSQIQDKKTLEIIDGSIKAKELEQDMQALVKLVLEENGGGVDRNIKQTFLSVFKTFYYSAYHDAETIDLHIFKVLFAPVV